MVTKLRINNQRGKYNIQDLVKRMPRNYRPVEMDWGKPEGKEVRSMGADSPFSYLFIKAS
jgi:hypothetical protein